MKTQQEVNQSEAVKMPVHQSVYENLRDRVLFGDLSPGQAVTIQGLSEDLHVGITPVREAIRRLTSEGALSMQGNRRVCVPVLTVKGTEQLEFMRQTLEPELGKLACKRIDPAGLAELHVTDDALNAAIANGDVKAYLTCNYQFHTLLYRTADAPIIAATVDRLWLRFGPSLRVVCGRFGTLNLPDKHAELLDALTERDPERAAQILGEDIAQGMIQIREALSEDKDAGDSIDFA